METKEIKLFIRFLKDNNSYFQFKKNFYLRGTDGEILAKYIMNNKPYNYFTSAFLWESTKEGGDYWKNQNALWRKQLCML